MVTKNRTIPGPAGLSDTEKQFEIDGDKSIEGRFDISLMVTKISCFN
jgi:hypothetical protein